MAAEATDRDREVAEVLAGVADHAARHSPELAEGLTLLAVMVASRGVADLPGEAAAVVGMVLVGYHAAAERLAAGPEDLGPDADG